MAFLTKGAWVLVADQGRAIVLENVGDTASPVLRPVDVMVAEVQENTDRPGRMPDVGPNQRSALEQVDTARLAGERMMRELAKRLGKAARAGRYESLVVVAPPQVLGVFRSYRCDAVQTRTIAEFDRNLSSQPLPRLAETLVEALAA